MAMKNTKKNNEVDVDSDHLKTDEPVTICDQLNETTPLELEEVDIAKLIVIIRDQQVLIDRDLAMLYGVNTKRLNQQVKRNISRFPERFRFQLNKLEMEELVAKCDRFKNLKHSSSPAYAFTEQGISMLSAVLTSQTAIEQSVKIMDAFVGMRRYLVANAQIFQRLDRVEKQQLQNMQWMENTDDKINAILAKMDNNAPKILPEQIFNTGCVWDAWAYVSDLIRSSRQRIVLIDKYVDDRVLSLLDKRNDGVEATIYTRYNETLSTDLKKHNDQYRQINLIQLPHRNHDRFLIIDTVVYLLGASLKDMGIGLCAITRMQTTPEALLQLLL